MARLSRAQEAARQRVLQLEGRCLLPAEAAQRLMSAVQLAVPADGWTVFGVDPGSLLFNRVIAVGPAGHEGLRFWLTHIYLAGEPTLEATFPGIMRANLSAVVFRDTIETCWGAVPALFGGLSSREYGRIYHEILTPAGGILRGCLAVRGRWVAALEMFRADPRGPFQPADGSFIRLIAPAMGRVLNSALEYERAVTVADDTPDGSGVLILDAEGRVRFSTPAAEACTRLLGDSEGIGPGGLPVVVWAAVARMRAAPAGRFERAVRVWTAAGYLGVEASSGVEDGSMAVVMSPERLPAPPAIPPEWPVTSREREVLALLVRGLGNRQIASSLIVSENTVESHLAHAYEKLGVNGRSELLARLFRETCIAGALPHTAG